MVCLNFEPIPLPLGHGASEMSCTHTLLLATLLSLVLIILTVGLPIFPFPPIDEESDKINHSLLVLTQLSTSEQPSRDFKTDCSR